MKKQIFIFIVLVLLSTSLYSYPVIMDVFYPTTNNGYLEECYFDISVIQKSLNFDELPSHRFKSHKVLETYFFTWNKSRSALIPIRNFPAYYWQPNNFMGAGIYKNMLIDLGNPILLIDQGNISAVQIKTYGESILLENETFKSFYYPYLEEVEVDNIVPYLPLLFNEDGSRELNPNVVIESVTGSKTVFSLLDGEYRFIYREEDGYYQELVTKNDKIIFSRWITTWETTKEGVKLPTTEIFWTIKNNADELYVKKTMQIIEGDFGPFNLEKITNIAQNLLEEIVENKSLKYGFD